MALLLNRKPVCTYVRDPTPPYSTVPGIGVTTPSPRCASLFGCYSTNTFMPLPVFRRPLRADSCLAPPCVDRRRGCCVGLGPVSLCWAATETGPGGFRLAVRAIVQTEVSG